MLSRDSGVTENDFKRKTEFQSAKLGHGYLWPEILTNNGNDIAIVYYISFHAMLFSVIPKYGRTERYL